MRYRHEVIRMLVVVVGFSGCGGGSEDDETASIPVQIKDSAGVRIVEHAGMPDPTAPFRFAAEPRSRHGTNPGDYAFQKINAGSLFPDGSAVVSDIFNQELVVLSPDGSSHEVLARRGEGPGDVSYVEATFALGPERLLAADGHRVIIFAGGSVERGVDIRHASGLAVHGIGSSGQLLMATNSFRSDFEAAWLAGHTARFDMETGVLDTVASYDSQPRPPRGLPRNPIEAWGWVAVAAGQFVYARSDRPQVTWSRPDGTVTQIVRWEAEATPLTEELFEGIEARLWSGHQKTHMGQATVAHLDEWTGEQMVHYRAVAGEPIPLFTAPFGDPEGRVWLARYEPGGVGDGVQQYTVISSDGEWFATVEVPPRFRILDVAHGLVLGFQLGEMDVESAVVYELVEENPGGGGPCG